VAVADASARVAVRIPDRDARDREDYWDLVYRIRKLELRTQNMGCLQIMVLCLALILILIEDALILHFGSAWGSEVIRSWFR
jgi:hypothetical protein